ncbi:MAG: hypothetical protein RIS94_479 [Pseudomonadota bacterium]|jgi:choline dehydrogenase-like flavoprotein
MPVHDCDDCPAQVHDSDILIVGAGAVGLAMAARLARQGRAVTVLEGGPPVPPADYVAANRGPMTGRHHNGATAARMKALGGTTRLWHGQLVQLSPGDFAATDAAGRTLWPIAHAEYRHWVDEALRLLGIDPRDADPARVWAAAGHGSPTLGHGLCAELGLLLPRPDFTQVFAREIAGPLVSVVTRADVDGLRFHPDGRVREVVAGRHAFRAREVVLACGTLEIARLLLRAMGQPDCPFAANAHVGRWFIDHLHGPVGTMQDHDARALQALFAPFVQGRHRYRVKARRDDATRQPGEANVALSLEAALSPGELRQEAVALLRRIAGGRGGLLRPLREGWALTRAIAPFAWRYATRRGLAGLGSGAVTVMAEIEQLPDAESRLFLDPETGRIGVHWHVEGTGELDALARGVDALQAVLAERGLGQIAPDPAVATRDPALFDRMWDNAHMCGGARMAESAAHGVTDPQGRVFGSPNLSVAGAATFPAGGFANSTLSAIALGLRVADRIAGQNDTLVGRLVYGCARLDGGALAPRSRRLLRMALAAGVRAVDVAPSYGMGLAEAVVGQVLAEADTPPGVMVIAKVGSARMAGGWLRSWPRALKRALRPPAPVPLERFAPMAPVEAFGWCDFTPAALAASHAVALRRLGRIDRLMLHECGPGEFGPAVADALAPLAAQTGAQWGYATTPAWEAATDERYPAGCAAECAIHPDILTGRMAPPAKPGVVFHSVIKTADWLARTDPAFADALERAAALVPGADRATGRIAGAFALAAARAPDARLVFASTHPRRLAALLAAFAAIDRDKLVPAIAACFNRGSA